jgi:CRISPR system Cascade subunit CasC
MLIQIHILQNYAPANLNRDDTGSPKDAIFGGSRRGRISSQCLKRSLRRSTAFVEAFEKDGLLGVRTKLLPDLIGEELEALRADEKVVAAIVQRVPDIGHKAAREAEEGEAEAEAATATKQLIFVGRNEVRPLAQKLLELYNHDPKKWAKVELEKELEGSAPRSVDIAMFGRMTTSAAFDNMQAAVQVAHALSTNALTQEFDYYTAVDDLSGESGAGMIGDIEFNSSTYYKYLSVHWEKLVENLGGDTAVARRAVGALVEAAATAHPSGKQNSFAAHNLPDLVVVEVRAKNLPVSYANAFIKPARASGDKSLVEVSVEKLKDYMARVGKTYGLDGKRAFIAVPDIDLPEAQALPSLAELQGWLTAELPEQ